MANEVKYQNQVWAEGTPIAGERLSTNGHYTGEHKGTVMQDASVEGTEQPHAVEEGIVRYGTMMGDATVGSMPAVVVSVVHKLTKCTVDKGDGVYEKNGAVTFTYTAAEGYELPSTITVKVGGATKTASTDYTWTVATGKLAFAANKLSADAEITVVATEAETEVEDE